MDRRFNNLNTVNNAIAPTVKTNKITVNNFTTNTITTSNLNDFINVTDPTKQHVRDLPVVGVFNPSDMSPDNTIPTSIGDFTKTIDLGEVVTSAYVLINRHDTTSTITLDTYVGILSLSGNSRKSNNFSIMFFVTEDYTEAKRFYGCSEEKNASLILAGLNNLNKTYAEIGDYLLGVENNGETALFVDETFSLAFVVRSIYLDNSGATTLLTMDFSKISGVAGGNLSSTNTIVVYKVE